MRTLARAAAIAIAVAGLFDPAIRRRVETPVAIETRLPVEGDPGFALAVRQRDALAAAMGGRAVFDGPGQAQAIVVFGGAEPPAALERPVIVVRLPTAAAVSVTRVESPPLSLPGQPVPVGVTMHARGVSGRKTNLLLELEGVRLATAEHTSTVGDEDHGVPLTILPGAPGLHHVRVIATTDGVPQAVADVGVLVRDRPLRVLAYEPRPSWPLTFVRRALEDDARFTVASMTQSSRGIATSTGQPPSSLPALDSGRYDAIVVGAPEDLTERDLDALGRFAAERGGQVLLMPDRPLSPRLQNRFRIPPLEEVLLDKPAAVTAGASKLQASELLIVKGDPAGIEPFASVVHSGEARTVLFAVPHGDGRIVVSGLLDSWRYRVAAGAFDPYWRSLLSEAALAAPEVLTVALEPNVVRPGEVVRLRAALRRTELRGEAGVTTVPALEAGLVTPDGQRQRTRLWPSARPGSFEGSFIAPRAGQYVVSISGDTAQADTILRVHDSAVQPAVDTGAAAEFAVASSGGAVVSEATDAVPLLERLERQQVEEPVRVMRSGWWIVPFAGLLCVEWAARRRRGLA